MSKPASNQTKSATILAVEDEDAIRELLVFSLERAGHKVMVAESVFAADRILNELEVDIALVDWMLPGGSGLEFVRKLRKDDKTRFLPIIMLTARTDEDDIATGLDAGADDYVTKPFSPRILNSRINALIRRSQDLQESEQLLRVGPLELNAETHRFSCNNKPVELGHTEFKLLRFFMENPERVFSRNQLLDQVWGIDTYIEERTVDVHILRLRKILKPLGADKMLDTVRGAGYRLNEK